MKTMGYDHSSLDNGSLGRKRVRRSRALAYIPWSEVAGAFGGGDRLRELASSMPTESVLIYISTMSIVLNNTPWDLDTLHAQQRALAHYLCTPEVARQVERCIEAGRGDVLVHEEQLLLAAKLALCYGQPGPAKDIALEQLGELLLGINDLLQQEEAEAATLHELMIIRSLRRRGITRNEQARYLLPRYFDLLVTHARGKSLSGVDFDRVFLDAVGFTIEQWMAFAFLYAAPFIGVASVKELQEKELLHVIQRWEGQIREPEILERCQRLFSQARVGFRSELLPAGVEVVQAGNLPVQEHPLFRLDNGSALPISLPLLLEKGTMGVYWMLHKLFSQNDPKEGVRTFTAFVGQLFQGYATDLFKRIYSHRPDGSQQFYDEQAILEASKRTRQHLNPPFDGAIVSGDSLILTEMSTIALSAQVMETGDASAFSAVIQRSFVPKINQLNAAFQGLADGTWQVPGLARNTIRHVYPVLVLLHPFPRTVATWKPLKAVATPSDWYQFGGPLFTTYVHEPQILTAEELEMLEPLLCDGGLSLPDLLYDKVSHPETATMEMKTFLLTARRVQERPNEHMLALYTTVTEHIRETLQRHLHLAPPAPNSATGSPPV
jgi:hypothetical protein